MNLQVYIIDAFTSHVFGGNPAAVCPLGKWLDDGLMQFMAMEHNLSETAFLAPAKGDLEGFEIRWFTPNMEVNLCGHATLAAAWVCFNRLGREGSVRLHSKSGLLQVKELKDGSLSMDFPVWPVLEELAEGNPVRELFRGAVGVYRAEGSNLLVELGSESELRRFQPPLGEVLKLPELGVIATAPGDASRSEYDFISRYFAPKAGIDEDPVTGSAHCTLTPFWAGKLGKDDLSAYQLSKRGGELRCRLEGDRVHLQGKAVLYSENVVSLPEG